ncbi:MAG: XdhC family protein [Pseudomonadota bacterium]
MHDMIATPSMLRGIIPPDPISELSATEGVLAVITGVEGSAYRAVGSAMAMLSDGARVGSLSSGCIEEALSIEASNHCTDDKPRHLRYGEGSPWIDIKLPCGAGLDIGLWPSNRDETLIKSHDLYMRRQSHSMHLPRQELNFHLTEELTPAGWLGADFVLPRVPPLQFLVAGTGVETVAFVDMARAAGYTVRVISPDSYVQSALSDVYGLDTGDLPPGLEPDGQTAVVLFFHGNEHETRLLPSALESSAFWIGTQGSRKKRRVLQDELKAAGVSSASLERLEESFGVIPSARDPQTLAVSVLADVVRAYKATWFDPYFAQPQKTVP